MCCLAGFAEDGGMGEGPVDARFPGRQKTCQRNNDAGRETRATTSGVPGALVAITHLTTHDPRPAQPGVISCRAVKTARLPAEASSPPPDWAWPPLPRVARWRQGVRSSAP